MASDEANDGTPGASPRARGLTTALITRVAAFCLTVAVVVALGVALHIAQTNSERQLAQRFEARGQLASSFASTWVAQLVGQQRRVATDTLSTSLPTDKAFESAVDVFDFPAAVLLDSRGRALAVHPAAPQLLGADLAAAYPHLQAALQGRPTISLAIVSASRSVPVVAFAVPYDTSDGRRVFSGAYELNRTPLGDFLNAVIPISGSRVYVVDTAGTILAAGTAGTDSEPTGMLPAALAAAHSSAPDGNYEDLRHRRFHYTSHPIAGAPWSLVLSAPHESLYAPVRGKARALPWMVLGFVALLAGAANWMLFRLLSGRDRLHALNTALDTQARTDPLTGVPNRRHLDDSLAVALSAGHRHVMPVSVLIMDIDHFKRVNDTYGHNTGDRVLEHVAKLLANAVRTEDVLGRWGGEEFLAVLPQTDARGALHIAERLRQLVGDTPYTDPAGNTRIVTTLSIGVASDTPGGNGDWLIHRADQALYLAKTEGRNSVRSAPSPPSRTGPPSLPRPAVQAVDGVPG